MTAHTYSHSATGFLPAAGRSNGTLASILKVLSVWNGRYRQRRQLAELEARQLADIGVSRSAATTEAARPFWQA